MFSGMTLFWGYRRDRLADARADVLEIARGASPRTPDRKVGPRPTRGQVAALMPALALLGALTLSGCEDKAIGRVCEIQAEGDENQALVNAQALECPTRVCLRPARDVTKAESIDTTSLCTAECSSDSDCVLDCRGERSCCGSSCPCATAVTTATS